MTIERSHGKARPTLPRLAEVSVPGAAPERNRQRDAKGRFVAGNSAGIGRGWKTEVRRMLGRLATNEATAALARDASRLYSAMLEELPAQGAQVNPLVASRARATVLSGYYAARGSELGLDSKDGRELMELSIKLDARAERLAVTALDLASKLAKSRPSTEDDTPWLVATPPDPYDNRVSGPSRTPTTPETENAPEGRSGAATCDTDSEGGAK